MKRGGKNMRHFSLKFNSNNVLININHNQILSPNKNSIISKMSNEKDISTSETNINKNLKNEIILFNNKNIKRTILKENKLSKMPNQSTKKSITSYNYKGKNKLDDNLEKIIKLEYNNNSHHDNNEEKNLNNSIDTNREIESNNIIIKRNQQQIQCLFCEKLCKDENYIKHFKCNHYFCKECGNIFYKNLIEQGQKNNFKCPVFSCINVHSEKFIKYLICLKFNDNNKTNSYSKKHNSITILENKDNFILNKAYSNNNMINNIVDINNNLAFYKYVRQFLFECPLCKDISLYGKIKGPYFKCLKCLKCYCKYCREEFNYSHFDLSYKGYCKVFYRIKRNKTTKNYFIIYFLKYILLYIAVFLFMSSFFINKIKNSFKIKNIFERIFFAFLFIILIIIFIPLSLLIIPYFPIIIAL